MLPFYIMQIAQLVGTLDYFDIHLFDRRDQHLKKILHNVSSERRKKLYFWQ